MDEPRLELLRVLRARRPAGSALRPNRQRHLQLSSRHRPVLRGLVDELLHREREEVLVHDLDDRAHALHRRADAAPDDRHLGDRRVADARRAELVEQPLGHRHRAAHLGDVLAHDEHAVVVPERARERIPHRLPVGWHPLPGIDVLERVFGLRVGPRLRELDRRLDLGGDLRVERGEVLVRELEPRAQELDRILRLALLLQLVLVAVHLRIAHEVAGETIRPEVEKHRALAGQRVLPSGERGEVHGLDVLAVRLEQLHPVGERALPELVRRERRVLPVRRRLRPAVVLEHEHRRDVPQLREVERLVEGARVRRAVPEEGEPDPLLTAHLERERRADDRRDPARDDGVRSEVPDLDVVQVHRARRIPSSSPRPCRTARP